LWNTLVVVALVVAFLSVVTLESFRFFFCFARSWFTSPLIGFGNSPLFAFLTLVVFPFEHFSSSLINHHSPLLVLGSKREFLRSLGSRGGLGSVNPHFSLESLVHSDFEAVAKPFSAKTSSSSFNTVSSASQCSIRFSSFVLCLRGSLEGHATSRTFFVFPSGEFLWSLLNVSWF